MTNISMAWIQAMYMGLTDVPAFVSKKKDLQQQLAAAPEHVLVACCPKSGSTFISNVLAAAMGMHTQQWCSRYGLNEQDLSLPRMTIVLDQAGIAQHHLRATEDNIDLIQLFGVKVIVLTRSIFDVIPSALDHTKNESLVWPAAHLPSSFNTWSTEARADLLIDHIVPWYVQFYVSWINALDAGNIPAVWAIYEDMVTDPSSFFAKLLIALGHPDASAVPEAIARVQGVSRLNVGKPGRGAELLTDTQQARIRQIVGRYPGVDFSKMGIHPIESVAT